MKSTHRHYYEVIRSYHSKEERQRVLRSVFKLFPSGEEESLAVHVTSCHRVKRRTWTVNRSPHGNKTARQQRGRDEWKRRRRRTSVRAQERVERRNGLGRVAQRHRREQ